MPNQCDEKCSKSLMIILCTMATQMFYYIGNDMFVNLELCISY